MDYATTDDVQAYFPANSIVLSTSTSPTLAEVGSWIADIEGDVNAALTACGYLIVPATGANDIVRLRGKVARKVAAMTWDAYYSKNDPAIPLWVKRYHDEFAALMLKLENCDYALLDQVPADAGSFHVGYATLYSETYADTET